MRHWKWSSLVMAIMAGAILLNGRAVLGAEPTSKELLADAAAAAAKVGDADEKADVLNILVMMQERTGDIAGARRTAETIGDAMHKGFAYGHIAEGLARSGDFAGARALIKVAGEKAGPGILESIVEEQAGKGDIAGAQATAGEITAKFYRAQADRRIGLAQAAAGDMKGALATVGAIGDEQVKVTGYRNLAAILGKAGKMDECKQMVELAKGATKAVPDYIRPMAMADVAAALVWAGDEAGATAIAKSAADDSEREMIVANMVGEQVKAGHLKEARETAALLGSATDRLYPDADIAMAQAAAGDHAGAMESLKDAMEGVGKQKEIPILATACGTIGAAEAKVEGLEKAAAWARGQSDPEVRARAIMGVVSAMKDYRGKE